jgi:F420H(2)-dependent quinone reductase
MHGDSSNYMRNIKADNRVRLRIHGRWRTGRAHLLPDDDAHARNAKLSWVNRTANSGLGTELLTVRIDLDQK